MTRSPRPRCGNPRWLAVTTVAVAALLVGCSGGGGSASSESDGSTTTTLVVVDNFIEDPLLAQGIVDKMVGPDTPIISLSFNQESVSVQERGRPDAYVVFRPVASGELGPTTTLPDLDESGEADPDETMPPITVAERGTTVLASEMTPEELEQLTAQLAAIDERNSQVLSEEGAEPIDLENEPYRFGETRADTWSYSASSSQATRTPTKLKTSEIETLVDRTFYTSEIDWAAFKPLMMALLAELDLGDTEAITSVGVSKNVADPGAGLIVSIRAEGERGTGSLNVVGGQISINRG